MHIHSSPHGTTINGIKSATGSMDLVMPALKKKKIAPMPIIETLKNHQRLRNNFSACDVKNDGSILKPNVK